MKEPIITPEKLPAPFAPEMTAPIALFNSILLLDGQTPLTLSSRAAMLLTLMKAYPIPPRATPAATQYTPSCRSGVIMLIGP